MRWKVVLSWLDYSDPVEQHQHEDDDQERSEAANSAMPVPIAIAAEAPTETAGEKDDQEDDEDQSKHGRYSRRCERRTMSVAEGSGNVIHPMLWRLPC